MIKKTTFRSNRSVYHISEKSNDFRDSFGLIKSKEEESDPENALLWTLQHIIRRNNFWTLERQEFHNRPDNKKSYSIDRLKNALRKCKITRRNALPYQLPWRGSMNFYPSQGIYAQHPRYAEDQLKVNEKERYMSADQLIVFFAAYKLWGWRHALAIWEEMLCQGLMRYDNITPTNPKRYVHPKHYAFCALCVNSWRGYVLLPVMVICDIWSCMASYEKTSGKLLAWVHAEVLGWRWFKWLLKKALIQHEQIGDGDPWDEVFSIYFTRKDHPNRVENLVL